MAGDFKVTWIDRGYEPENAADPAYPFGRDLDASGGRPSCRTSLPYPAKRCGYYVAECQTCGYRAIATTAGRHDDPVSITVACPRAVQ